MEVRDSWVKSDGTAESGSLTFTPSVKVKSLSTGQQIAPTPAVQRLDGQGKISVLLPATDDPDYDPTGWTYTVNVNLDGFSESYSVEVPSASAGSGLDLGLMTRASSSGGVYRPAPDQALALALGARAWLLL